VDTRTSVDDQDYQPPFHFNGTIDKLTFKLIPPVMKAEEEKLLQRATLEAKIKAQ
jgi:arylsulfatase